MFLESFIRETKLTDTINGKNIFARLHFSAVGDDYVLMLLQFAIIAITVYVTAGFKSKL